MAKTKSKLHKWEIRQRKGAEGKIMTGATTQILLDGKPLRGIRSARFEVDAGGVAKMHLEVLGNFAISGVIGKLEKTIVPLVPQEFKEEG